MRIGILGGSFDPVHQGHLTLARESEKQFLLEKILFIPAAHPPHKTKEGPHAPAPLRARMVELAIQGRGHWELCDLELRRPGVSYTVDTLRELRKIYPPPHKLFFIVGADSFCDLKNWKEPEEVLKLSDWIVASRPSVPLPAQLPPKFHRLEVPLMAISASEIREKAERGEDLSPWVPLPVREYLVRMKIYQKEKK